MRRHIQTAIFRATSLLRGAHRCSSLSSLIIRSGHQNNTRFFHESIKSGKENRSNTNLSKVQLDRNHDVPPLPPFVTLFNSLQERASNAYSHLIQTPEARLMRLDKPIGTHLLFLPCTWSITFASTPEQFLYYIPLFYVGSVLLRSAGCTINDIWDVDLDRKVERTNSRPIAAGEISIEKAWVLLGGQLLAGLGILTQLNTTSFLLGSICVLPVLFYPFAKRHTAYPQLVLAGTFNVGTLLGYTAITDSLAIEPFLLYGAGMCWTMVYDTIYSFQDKHDDERVGINSTARSFGPWTRPVLSAFVAAKWGLLMTFGGMTGLSSHFGIGASLACARLLKDVYFTDLRDPQSCHQAFVGNAVTGAMIWSSILLGRL